MKTNKGRNLIAYGVVIALSILLFLSIYGYRVLNPFYTDWLFEGGDLSQHYVGWLGYRQSAWMFPIGMTDQISNPIPSSVIFTDSIPICAVFFKLFRNILPYNFQYFGPYAFVCFILTGVFGFRLLYRFTHNRIYSAIGAMFFVLSPAMMLRVFFHTALASHWLILMSLDLMFSQKEKGKVLTKQWALLGLLVSSIHVYFLFICGLVVAAAALEDLLRTKKILNVVKILFAYVLTAAITIFLLGGFNSGVSSYSDGLGGFSFNLNSLFNPMDWTNLLPSLSIYHDAQGQYEGFNYLGCGLIILLVFAIISLVVSSKVHQRIKKHISEAIAVLVLLIVTLIAAAGPVVTFGDHLLFTIPTPGIIFKVWSTFRATGRMGWVILYVVMLFTMVFAYYLFNERVMIALLAVLFVVQGYDLKDQIQLRHSIYANEQVASVSLTNTEFWDAVGSIEDAEHLVFANSFGGLGPIRNYEVCNFAFSHNLSISSYYFARDNAELTRPEELKALENPDETQIFLFDERNVEELGNYNLHYYEADGYIVGYINEIPGLTEALTYE